jgi:hypothetical protein
MADSHDLQVLIILALIPLVIAAMSSLLDARDAAASLIEKARRSFIARIR